MKIINQYKFKNKKTTRVCWLSDKDRKGTEIPECDNLLVDWSVDGKHFKDGLYMRPDEVLTLAKQLIDAVYKTTGAYQEKLLKGYYGYKEFKL